MSLLDNKSDKISQLCKDKLKDQEFTTTRTPRKHEPLNASLDMLQKKNHQSRAAKSAHTREYLVSKYNPTAYMLKVQITLVKILTNLLTSFNHVVIAEREDTTSRFTSELLYLYGQTNECFRYWLALSVKDSIDFALDLQSKWVANYDRFNIISKCFVHHSEAMSVSSHYIFNPNDLLNIVQTTAESGMLLCLMLIQDNGNETDMKEIIRELKDAARKCNELTKESHRK